MVVLASLLVLQGKIQRWRAIIITNILLMLQPCSSAVSYATFYALILLNNILSCFAGAWVSTMGR